MTAIGTGVVLSAGQLASRVLGANERVIVGVIGCGGQGRANMRDFLRQPEVQIAAVCDVYEANLSQAREITDDKAAVYKDFRKLLEHKDLDAVIIATPDHWHALPTIHACDAGKDVYLEKPVSHTIGDWSSDVCSSDLTPLSRDAKWWRRRGEGNASYKSVRNSARAHISSRPWSSSAAASWAK